MLWQYYVCMGHYCQSLCSICNIMIQDLCGVRPLTSTGSIWKSRWKIGRSILRTWCLLQYTYNQQITNPTHQLLVPIIHWIDQTSSGTGNDLCLLKSPVIFTEPFRQTIKAWVYHGQFPNCNIICTEQNALPRSNCKATWAAILCYFLFPIDLLEFTWMVKLKCMSSGDL